MLGTALLLDLVWIQPDVDRLEADSFASQADFDALRDDIRGRQTTNLVIVGVGTAVAITGVVLLLWDADAAPDNTTRWFIAPTGVGARW